MIVPDKIVDYIAPYLLEQTLFPIESDKYGFMKFDKEQIDKALSKLKVLAIGMGWGEGKENGKILEYILENYEIKVLIDADGLNILAKLEFLLSDIPKYKSFKLKPLTIPPNDVISKWSSYNEIKMLPL